MAKTLLRKVKKTCLNMSGSDWWLDRAADFLRFLIKRNPVGFVKKDFNRKHPYWAASTSLIIIIAILSGSIWFAFLRGPKSQAAWWNDSWAYRKSITVSNNSTYVASNIPYRVILDTQSLISAGKMKSDGSDLRVVDINGKSVRFQLEKSTLNTSTTGIWIEGNVDAKNSAAYFIYYGNQQALAQNFASDVSSVVNDGETVEMKDGYGYSTNASYGKISDMRKDGTNLGVNGTYRYTDSYPGNWWDDRQFSRTLLSQGPMFVEVKYEDTNYGSYSSFGTIVKMFRNGFVEEMVYMNYNASGTENLYYYLNFDTATRNSVWVNGSETLVDQAADSGTLYQADLGDNWFGQRWTADGRYGGTIINKNNSDWHHGYTSAQNSYFQTNYSTSEAFSAGGSRQIRYGTFAGNGGIDEMKVKGSTYGANSSNVGNEEQAPAPVAYWKFDEGSGNTANDSTNNNNNGNINGASWRQDSDCISGKCLSFDGVDDYVVVGANKFGSDRGSVSIWFRPDKDMANSSMIFGHQNGDNRLYIGSDSWPRIKLGIAGSGGINSGQDVEYGVWQHAVLTYDNGAWNFYYNGKQVSSGNYSGSIIFSSPEIGDEGGSSWVNNYKGAIDEVKIYPFARSAEQIKMDYNSGLAGSGAAEGSAQSFGGKSDKWLTDGLVGHWKMDETSWNGTAGEVKDASGNNNNGTSAGGATAAVAKYGNGGSFDGTDDYVNMGNPTHYQFINTSSFSMSAWIKTNDLSGFEHIIGKGYGGYRLAKSNDTISFRLNSNQLTAATPSLLNTSDWFHVVAVYDGITKNAKIYVNGQQQANSTNTSVNWTSTSDNFQIGNSPNESYYFNGKIDEARTYNRALSPEEVRKLYDWAPGPVLHYKLDENAGTSASDFSGNGINGNMVNSPTWTQGKYGSAVKFAGTSDYVNVNNTAMLNPAYVTVEAWAKFDSLSDRPHIVGKGDGSSGAYWIVVEANGLPRFYYSKSGGAWANAGGTAGDIVAGDWYHFAGVYDGTKAYIYVNGVLKGSASDVGVLKTDDVNPLRLGRNSGDLDTYAGMIDDVKIYNYARTTDQIVEDMSGGGSDADSGGGTVEPLAYWKFDEGSGTTANNVGFKGSSMNLSLATSTATPQWENSGKFNKAVHFDGSDDYVYNSSDNAILKNGSESGRFTISAWVKPDGVQAGGERVILGRSGCHSGLVANSNNSFSFNIAATDCWTSGKILNGGAISNWTDWHHVVGVYDNRLMKIYIDGVLKNATTFTASIYSHDNNLYSGSIGTYAFDGIIDELKIYNAALSEEEVEADYNQGKSAVMSFAGMSAGGVGDGSANAEYCVPGDSTSCSAPVGEWKFDEKNGTTVSDTGSGGRNATLTNGPTWVVGKKGSAANFDGTDDYASISRFDLGSSGITLEAWVKSTSSDSTKTYTGNAAQNVIGDNTNGVGLGFGLTGGKIQYMHYNSAWASVNGTANVNDGNWHHIVATHNTSGAVALYLDGKLDNSGTVTFSSNRGINRIGGGYESYVTDATGDEFNGSIDHVMVYNYGRTPAQVAYDYNRGAPVGWWKFDECQGGTAYDSSGNGNNGTINIGSGGTQTSAGTCTNSGTAWGNGTSGKFNSSLNFDGTDDYATRNMTVSPLNGTVALWVKNPAAGVGNYIFRADANFRTYISIAGSTIGFVKGNPAVFPTSTSAPSANIWKHVALKWWTSGGTSYCQAYADGIPTGSPLTFTDSTAGTFITVAGYTQSGTQNASGQFDDVRVYNYALTDQQIKNVMNEGSALRFGN